MSTIINNGRDNYLHCSISDRIADYWEEYTSYEECISDIRPNILQECEEQGYNEYETTKVVSHYEIRLNNSWPDANN